MENRCALIENSTHGKLTLFDRFVGHLIDREPTPIQKRKRYGNGNEEYPAESFEPKSTPVRLQARSGNVNRLKSSYLCTKF